LPTLAPGATSAGGLSGNRTPIFQKLLYTYTMQTYTWYSKLIKPTWAPPSWLFGPVWSVLYIIIIISFGTVFYKVSTRQLPAIILLPFVLNLIFNLLFTPIQFGLQNNYLAALDILLVLGTLIWAMIVIYPHFKWIALINIPYLLWVCFATVLQLTITFLNK
jgi:translocator protein